MRRGRRGISGEAGATQAVVMESYANGSGLETGLLALVRSCAARLVGCGPCLDRYRRQALAAGESAERLAALPTWRDAGVFDQRERAALLWTEAVTLLWPDDVSDDVYAQVRDEFSGEELVALTVAAVAVLARSHLADGEHAPGRQRPRQPGPV